MARRRWDEETIAQTLGEVVAELGRMPTRTELERRDLSSLWSAMRRNGGTRVWAARADDLAAATVSPATAAGPVATPADPAATAPPEPTVSREDQIRVRAYFLAIHGAPGGPEEHWLRAERELAA
jgi:hypothetical protein